MSGKVPLLLVKRALLLRCPHPADDACGRACAVAAVTVDSGDPLPRMKTTHNIRLDASLLTLVMALILASTQSGSAMAKARANILCLSPLPAGL